VQNAQTGDLLRKTVVEANHDRAVRAVRLRRRRSRALRPLRRGVGISEVVVLLGLVASAFGLRAGVSDIALAAELSDPAIVPLDPARRAELRREAGPRG
jgi:N-methylhydantoinase A